MGVLVRAWITRVGGSWAAGSVDSRVVAGGDSFHSQPLPSRRALIPSREFSLFLCNIGCPMSMLAGHCSSGLAVASLLYEH